MNTFLLLNIIFTSLDIFIIIYAFSLQFFSTEWRNKREIEYKDMGIDINRAWGEHYGE